MAPPDKTLMYGQGSGGEVGEAIQPTDPVPEETQPVVEEPGKVIAGRYEILRNLADGGMGSVYVARQLDLNREVALKVIGGEDEDLQERFRREAVALADISHPAVVEVYDFIAPSAATGGRSYLVMAYVPGKNLDDHLRSLPEGHMETQALADLFLTVASAVVELHDNGIIHRDLKPGNLVFSARADGHSSIKLVDFGIAKRELEEGLTAAGYVLGTPAYMAPEAMVGAEKTPDGDVYALGATMFELATGEAPFGSGTTAQILRRAMTEEPQLPRHLQSTTFGALLLRMLSRDKDHRPNALQVFRELEKIEHELYRPPSQSILPAVPQDAVDAAVDAAVDSAEIPRGESPLVTVEPPERPDPSAEPPAASPGSEPEPAAELAGKGESPESEPSIYAPMLASEGDVAPAPAQVPAPPPPPRNWAKLLVLVVGPMVLLALGAGFWLRMDGRQKRAGRGGTSSSPPMAMGSGAGEPARTPPGAGEPRAMEPRVMEPRAMEPRAMEPAMSSPREPGPELRALIRGCRKKEGAKALHRAARRALRDPAKRLVAEQALLALLECKGSKRWRRRGVALQLAELYALMGRCGDAARAFKGHLDLLSKAQKKKGLPAPPKCPASAP